MQVWGSHLHHLDLFSTSANCLPPAKVSRLEFKGQILWFQLCSPVPWEWLCQSALEDPFSDPSGMFSECNFSRAMKLKVPKPKHAEAFKVLSKPHTSKNTHCIPPRKPENLANSELTRGIKDKTGGTNLHKAFQLCFRLSPAFLQLLEAAGQT